VALVLVWLHGANSEDTKNSLAVGYQLPGQGYFFMGGARPQAPLSCDTLANVHGSRHMIKQAHE